MAADASIAVPKVQVSLTPPSQWNVVFHNDDTTPFEFVEFVLIHFFDMTAEAAGQAALKIHHTGKAVVGTYVYSVAESKVHFTLESAKINSFDQFNATLERQPS